MAKKILLIDDEKISMALVRFGLTQQNFDIIEATDGVSGLEKVKAEMPDLVVVDLGMPNMNGFEFIQEMKAIDGVRDIPVFVTTANETMEDVVKMEGVKEYFIKPVDLELLAEKVKLCLG